MLNRRSGNRGLLVYIFVIGAIVFMLYSLNGRYQNQETYTHEQFLEDISEKKVSAVEIRPNSETPTGSLVISLKTGQVNTLNVSDTGQAEEELKKVFPSYTASDVSRENWFLAYILPILLGFAVVFIVMAFMNSQSANSSGGNRMMNFGKSRATKTNPNEGNVQFKDVAGLKEEKEDLQEIVDFLRNPGKYAELGARIPKGVLLVGPPGTGKTLLAKAVAGEARVPFFSISGSDFVEMFVGVGASRVRDLFAEAKKNRPCIVFIDEIDAVARRRGTGLGGGHDEREQTLNQLLVEMDGFGVNEGIIVMAATNRVDILDPAIMRPGRFDRKVGVGRPDVGGREEILKVHSRNKPLGDDVNLTHIAQTTTGFTGADLENLLNEAAIDAARENRSYIRQEDIQKAFVKVGIGTEKKSKVVSERDKKITAFHESGHALLFHLLPDVGPVYMISIIPTGMSAAGYTMPLPEKDEEFMTRGKMLNQITVDMGGRVAEEMFCDDITTGASQDIKQATALARNMVTKYGMSDRLGVVNYDNNDDEVFLGRDLVHTRGHSDDTAGEIDAEVKSIVEKCYAKAKELIGSHRDALIRCAEALLVKEKLTKDEFEAIFDGRDNGPSSDSKEDSGDPDSKDGGFPQNPTPVMG
ncbi:MAG: ATP-dependent zinc metalloprotease FtsH [Lachnospiraceae bacterium]|nr:ATP-dependent zinc metalloprotease FtsH [Lachnospiraceae bacterium]